MAAGKEIPLSIVLRTVDRATAPIRAVADRLKRITAPMQNFGKAVDDLGKNAGFAKVADGFRGVGSVLRDLWSQFTRIAMGVAAAISGLKRLVDSYDDLGDSAEKVGLTVDQLAQLRYAAELSGAEVGELDQAMQAFSQNLGAARAGTGRMAAFLKIVSPVLLKQLQATKSNAEAFLLLGDAMAKIQDPAKRSILAQKTLGNSALAPLLAKGGPAIKGLMAAYAGLAGSQKLAAEEAGRVKDALANASASFDSVKAAIVTGLGPAFKELIERVTRFFVENRERIGEWVRNVGEKLPAAIQSAVNAFNTVLGIVGPVWDKIGGLSGAVKILSALIIGKLIYAIGALGVAIMTTPIGWILAGLAALAAAVYAIYDNWGPISDFFAGLWDGVKSAFSSAWDFIKGIVDQVLGAVDLVRKSVGTVLELVPGNTPLAPSLAGFADAGLGALGPRGGGEMKVKVDFANAPKGTRVTADSGNDVEVDLNVGYNLLGGM